MDSQFSDFIVYADESGDHGMISIDSQYPVFVLVFCVIRKTDYINSIVPAMQRFKFKFWGHDSVILHEREIRRGEGDFAILRTDRGLRERFFSDLNALVESAPMTLFSLTVDKKRLDNNYPNSPLNPYETGLIFCMDWLRTILTEQGEHGKSVTVIFESRGRREDANLESQFRDIARNESWLKAQERRSGDDYGDDFSLFDFQPVFVPKAGNCPGLQLADLIARPIGLSHLRPNQPNRAWNIIKTKPGDHQCFPRP
ncbi:MAG TPA: DUF3800 domain-containing protein [Synechococcus sp. UBA8638]|nr:DUF3800 domain-containing protein [Synechococcus sp. UBA8638]